MMEMRQFIEMGEEKAGGQSKLAEIIQTRYTTLVAVKAGKRSLTAATCIKLARYINVEEIEVIAASNLIIEKDEERRKIFESCLKKAGKVAGTTAAALVISVMTISGNSLINNSEIQANLQKYTLLAINNQQKIKLQIYRLAL
jgi:DNA-binding XRE family transcriptional regulator